MAWGGRGGRGGGRSSAGMSEARSPTGQFGGSDGGREDSIDRKQNAMAVTQSKRSQSSLHPGLATAMFGQKLGAQVAGIKGITVEAASNLAQRINIGQIKMEANNIENETVRGLAFGPLASVLNEIGKFSAQNVLNEIIAGTGKAIYNDRGQITGVKTDDRGIIAGYGPEKTMVDGGDDRVRSGTFTSSTNVQDSTTAVDSGSQSSLIPSSKARGVADSSGSGRRSMFGRKVR